MVSPLRSPCRYIGTPKQCSSEHGFDHCVGLSIAGSGFALPNVSVSVAVPPGAMFATAREALAAAGAEVKTSDLHEMAFDPVSAHQAATDSPPAMCDPGSHSGRSCLALGVAP